MDKHIRYPMMAWLLMMALGLGAAPPSLAQEPPETAAAEPARQRVIVLGSRPVQESNIAKAREDAIQQALAQAVQQAALGICPPESIQDRLKQFADAVRGNPQDFVTGYKVVGEVQLPEECLVLVDATVSTDLLSEKLEAFAGAAAASAEDASPRILFLLSEQSLDQHTPVYWWAANETPVEIRSEAAMTDEMTQMGLAIVEHGSKTPEVPIVGAILFEPDLQNPDAVDIGKHLKADVVIAGKAIVYKAMNADNNVPQPINATVTARAIRVENGQEIESVLETMEKTGTDEKTVGAEALDEASRLASRKLAQAVNRFWNTDVHPTQEMFVIVRGSGSLGNFIRFRQALSAIPGVKGIQVQRVSGDETSLIVQHSGESEALISAIREKQFELFTLDVGQMSSIGLPVTLVPKTQP